MNTAYGWDAGFAEIRIGNESEMPCLIHLRHKLGSVVFLSVAVSWWDY
jgi:hypothetical protein